MPITHKFVHAKSDGADTTVVRPSNWNDSHAFVLGIRAVSSSGAIADTDEVIHVTTGSSTITMTLPTAVGRTGMLFHLKKTDSGSGSVVIATTSSQTIDGLSTYSLTNPSQYVRLYSDGSNWEIHGAN